MSFCTVRLLPDDVEVRVQEGTTISEAARQAKVYLTHPCGGRGACGRCIVFADGNPVKACVTRVTRDMAIHIPDTVRMTGQAVLTDIRLYHAARQPGAAAGVPAAKASRSVGAGAASRTAPWAERVDVELAPSTLDDPADDLSRLRDALSGKLGLQRQNIGIETACLKKLPAVLRKKGGKIQATVIYENQGATVLSFSEGPIYGLAVDIGTTTMVTALCDLETGYVLDTVGMPNPQAEYGADVISRIVYTEESEGGMLMMQKAVLGALAESVSMLAGRLSIDPSEIPVMTVAANTVMCHLLLGIPCDHLRREPYVPAAREYPLLRPDELGLPLMPGGRIHILPGVSSYVGGDIVAGVMATGLPGHEGFNILVDIGTNGEIVLAGEGFMVACSCSAGPAFEGSGISCGSRAVSGAVDNVYYHNGRMIYDVIGGYNVKAASLCGSGLISLMSALLRKGAIDRAGRFTTEEKSFALTPEVAITQADIFNLIRSKAAIFAGIRVLATHMEVSLSDISKIYIAGGFGRSLNMEYAVDIGMLPPLPKGSFSFVGNSSLAGALLVLNDRFIDTLGIAESIMNLELSVDNRFMDEFTKACFLPHTDQFF